VLRVFVSALGILGGTFDPVHCGHLRLAVEMLEQLSLAAVRLVPASHPPHRDPPKASSGLRLAMLKAAISEMEGLDADDRELHRQGPSYMVDTLKSLRQSFPDQPLCLIVGTDAFRDLNRWHRWREILNLTHIGVAQRPGTALPQAGEVGLLLTAHQTTKPHLLHRQLSGLILACEIPALDISSSRIRTLLAQGRSVRYLIPDSVFQIIRNNGIYNHAK
jgi:nicotinate-nucleotide adenylyltransferase